MLCEMSTKNISCKPQILNIYQSKYLNSALISNIPKFEGFDIP